MASGPRGSVIVPTFNRCAALIRLLDSLSYQTMEHGGFEVIVSVDGSTDGTQSALRGYEAPFRLRFDFHENVGRARSCNIGASLATGRTLIFLDDDMVPASGFVEAHLSAHDLSRPTAIVGTAPIDLAGCVSPAGRYAAERFNRHLEKLIMPGFDFRARDFYSGNFSINRAFFLELGGFDESFKVYGNEDVDLSIRLRSAGITIRFSPDATAVQHNDKTFESLANDSINKGRTAVILAAKHPHVLSELRLNWIREMPALLRAVQGVAHMVSIRRLQRYTVTALASAEQIPAMQTKRFYERAFGVFFWLGALAQIQQDYGTLPGFLQSLSGALSAASISRTDEEAPM
jgi:GT2 family glycosyltransferase